MLNARTPNVERSTLNDEPSDAWLVWSLQRSALSVERSRAARLPRIAADEFALIEPDFHARRAQRLAHAPRRLRVLRRLGEKNGGVFFRAHFSCLSASPMLRRNSFHRGSE